ncbi:MAG TPA: hypothetical protein VF334_06740 [Polyangia bacterium]
MVRPVLFSSLLALAACKSSPAETCSPPVACAQGSVETCATPDQTRCSYHTSAGDVFDCSACGDCNDAAQKVASWCAGPATGTGGDGTTAPGTQAIVCKTYLDCAAVAAPTTFPQLVPVYGPSGSCWSDASLAASCAKACTTALAALAMSSSAPECHLSFDMAIPNDLAHPPADLSSTDMAGCYTLGFNCQDDPTCCAQCCVGSCGPFGMCGL